ncbi:MAG TPA: VOC family protein [Solirubrobacteraceae bacterium]|nr:VOC family protein [Solirubrobacteraceae bacterium]
MGVYRIEELHYGVEDVEECTRFFSDFGLERSETERDGALFLTAVGQRLHLHPADDPTLPPALEDGSTIREVVWGVQSTAELRELGNTLGVDRDVSEDADGTLHTHDQTGFGIGLRVAEDTGSELWHRGVNATGSEGRWNEPLERLGRAHPYRFCHVALFIPTAGWEEAVAFYTERLRFRVTDQLLDMGTFMQAESDQDQHTLLLAHRQDKTAINHVAYEVSNFDEVVEGGNHMVASGWKESRRFGRHTIGSNVFRFFLAPCGGRVELAADMDRVDDSYGPNIYAQRPPHHMWMLTTNGQKEEL